MEPLELVEELVVGRDKSVVDVDVDNMDDDIVVVVVVGGIGVDIGDN